MDKPIIDKPTEDFSYEAHEGIYGKPDGLRGCPICGSTRQLTIPAKEFFLEYNNCAAGKGAGVLVECQYCRLILYFRVTRPENLTDEEWYEYARKAATRRWNTRSLMNC